MRGELGASDMIIMRFVKLFGVLAVTAMAFPANATIIGGAVTGGTALADGGVFQKLVVPFSAIRATSPG